ncbi:MAG: nucleotidyl transferase AbiEii/AbiGii toxin family protein, partial [Chloroflexi bacterium]|nr:nucleotidyl transferase AbiEii/AbiGii toxin family protein [Chloroflexota bacterium]
HIALHLRHHDRASLLAGKLQAILNRTYIKGRDWYDLWWYLQQPDWPLPNFAYSNSGLHQAGSSVRLSKENWKTILRKRTQALNWPAVFNDVEPFIIDIEKQRGFTQHSLLELLTEPAQ